jgi:hypothetical protein
MIFLVMQKVVHGDGENHGDEGIFSLLRHFATRVTWLIKDNNYLLALQ